MTLLKISAQGGVMILLVVLLRAAARRQAPKKIFPALWGLVCLCLLCPFRLTVTLPVPLPEPPAMAAPSPILFAPPETAAVGDTVSRPAPVPAGGIRTADVLSALWAAVALGVALYFVSTHLYYRRKYRAAAPVEDGPVRDWLAAHPLRRRVTVKRGAQVASPLTYGVFRPVILLPANFPTEGEGLAFVLEHELAHIRRWDAARKWVLALAVSVHWFNPLVWLMYVLANRDMELACDEAVTHPMERREQAAYLMFLLDLAERQSAPAPLGNGFGKNAIEERVMTVMRAKKTPIGGKVAIGAAVALVAVAGLLTVAVAAENSQAPPVQAQTPAPAKATAPSPVDPSATPKDTEPLDITVDVRVHPITGEKLERGRVEERGKTPPADPSAIPKDTGPLDITVDVRTHPITGEKLEREQAGSNLSQDERDRAMIDALLQSEEDFSYYAYMDLASADESLHPVILAARRKIIFQQNWIADDIDGYVSDENGNVVESVPHFSELFPADWDIPTVSTEIDLSYYGIKK